ncbi:hypothetical protein [Paenibacillus sp. Leaf72]|uniref:hypothetical protein n=1 Tax=Paenibacillus sp. Leaf72 TaxID=1736234 RepID=UPI000AF83143|nr:hypothetical protein [Paenibacillus sp. Leaf72]
MLNKEPIAKAIAKVEIEMMPASADYKKATAVGLVTLFITDISPPQNTKFSHVSVTLLFSEKIQTKSLLQNGNCSPCDSLDSP